MKVGDMKILSHRTVDINVVDTHGQISFVGKETKTEEIKMSET